MSTPPQVKGTPLKSFLSFLDQELTPEQRESVFAKVPGETAARLKSKQVLATEYVPVSLLNQITEQAATVKGEPIDQFARRAGRYGAREAVNTVMRFLLRVFTPDSLIQKGAAVWKSVYDRGELEAVREEGTRARVILHDFPSEPVGCARITGWIEEMTSMTGVSNVSVRQVKCFAKGAPACEWEITWK
jgi:hypothetical protein